MKHPKADCYTLILCIFINCTVWHHYVVQYQQFYRSSTIELLKMFQNDSNFWLKVKIFKVAVESLAEADNKFC